MRKTLVGLVAILVMSSCVIPSPRGSDGNQSAAATPGGERSNTFKCRLPIFTAPEGGSPTLAFLDLQSRVTTPIDVVLDPKLGEVTYDWNLSKWLPVDSSAVSPDGRFYAYGAHDADEAGVGYVNRVHVVDVLTGSDKSFDFDRVGGSAAPGVGVVRFTAEGIYLSEGYGFIQGLWLMDPTSGGLRKLVVGGYPELVSGGVLWEGQVNPLDPKPYLVPDSGYGPNEIDRLTLRDGSSVRWLYRPGHAMWVVGLDQLGNPLVLEYSNNEDQTTIDLILVLEGGRSQTLFTSAPASTSTFSRTITDAHGTWFGGESGLFLYSQNGGFRKIADTPAQPAGPCR